ncbi:MAG TPA: formate/nitrite transporter family protein [Candidatus Scatomorpha stercorigallinarum]|nr:formate/nitrite transporter family protein [Candidatus Scatomorpha stercorigallinarum]
MKAVRTFAYGVMAGFFVSIGGTAFLSIENRVVAALFFTTGLFAISNYGFNLFTGKVCYLLDNGPGYLWDLALIWLGNLGGTLIATALLGLTRVHPALAETAAPLVAAKLGDGLLSVFVLSVFCNVLIFIAVDGYRIIPDALGKYLALFLGVAVFAISGFEHCVANMYFISLTGSWSADAVLFIIVNTVGNSLGGLLVPAVKKIFK